MTVVIQRVTPLFTIIDPLIVFVTHIGGNGRNGKIAGSGVNVLISFLNSSGSVYRTQRNTRVPRFVLVGPHSL